MNFKVKSILLSFLIILMMLLGVYNAGFPQSVDNRDIPIVLSLEDLRELDKQTQEYPILKDLVGEQKKAIDELQKALSNEKKAVELNQREIDLQTKIIFLKDQEIAMKDKAFADMKEVTDRALKLAETKKSNPIWTTLGLVIGAIAVGIAIGAL